MDKFMIRVWMQDHQVVNLVCSQHSGQVTFLVPLIYDHKNLHSSYRYPPLTREVSIDKDLALSGVVCEGRVVVSSQCCGYCGGYTASCQEEWHNLQAQS